MATVDDCNPQRDYGGSEVTCAGVGTHGGTAELMGASAPCETADDVTASKAPLCGIAAMGIPGMCDQTLTSLAGNPAAASMVTECLQAALADGRIPSDEKLANVQACSECEYVAYEPSSGALPRCAAADEAGFAALKDCATEGATTCEMTECGTAAIFAVSPTCTACIIGTAAAQAERAGAGRRLQAGLPDGFDITPELIQVIEGTCAPVTTPTQTSASAVATPLLAMVAAALSSA